MHAHSTAQGRTVMTGGSVAQDLSRRLARSAEAVCRHYLSNGRRQGRYWIVGNTQNAPGRSLYVRLDGPDYGPGAAGKWTDAATGEYGDLLDLIAANRGLLAFTDTLDEARRFLSLPTGGNAQRATDRAVRGSQEAARRLFAMGRPIPGTLADAYLSGRGLIGLGDIAALRFHPNCYYWREDRPPDAPPESWPALLAKVTDLHGNLTGVHRTWIDPVHRRKAPVDEPRKAMGALLGHGVRIGEPDDGLAIGEGLETMLSLRVAIRSLPIVAALSANHLAALRLPSSIQRLYIAGDADAAGASAAAAIEARSGAAGIDIVRLRPRRGDFNEDLLAFGRETLRMDLASQFDPDDTARWLRGVRN